MLFVGTAVCLRCTEQLNEVERLRLTKERFAVKSGVAVRLLRYQKCKSTNFGSTCLSPQRDTQKQLKEEKFPDWVNRDGFKRKGASRIKVSVQTSVLSCRGDVDTPIRIRLSVSPYSKLLKWRPEQLLSPRSLRLQSQVVHKQKFFRALK